MANDVRNNPPAFPRAALSEDCGRPYGQQDGMTLRDWFAGQALAALVKVALDEDGDGADLIGPLAYRIADGMIAARKGGAA